MCGAYAWAAAIVLTFFAVCGWWWAPIYIIFFFVVLRVGFYFSYERPPKEHPEDYDNENENN